MNRSLIICLLVFTQTAVSQTTFHGNNARTGVYDSSGPRQMTSVSWTFKTGGPIVSSPAIAGGLVLVGSLDNHLYAIDQQTGKEKWKLKTDGPIASSAVVANGLVYFNGDDGVFYAVTAATGVVKWRFFTEQGERRFEAKGLHGAQPSVQTMPDPYDMFTSSTRSSA